MERKRLMMVLVAMMLSIGTMLAQNQIKGTVISSEDGQPVIGATVKVVGTKENAVTDVSGQFSLNAKMGAVLEISYIGMTTKRVNASSDMKITLDADNQMLDEVVVQVAYGSAKKSSLTGAITSVNSKQIEMRPVTSAASALEGSVSGVQINSSVGDPTVEPSIVIRGIGTVNGSSTPLYVVDGVPFGGNISDINASDIESISVLKDAASAALYGNRASAGVVLVTTKQGHNGKLAFDLKASWGTYSRGTKEYKRVGPKDWMNIYYQNIRNGLMAEGKGVSLEEATAEVQNNLISKYLYTNIFDVDEDKLFDADGNVQGNILPGYADDLDWYDQAIRHGKREEYVFSGSASADKSNYYFSVGYLNNEGYVRNSGMERFTGRLNVNMSPKKWIKAGLNLNASHQRLQNSSGTDEDNSDSYTNVFMYARNIAPIYPVHLHDSNGDYVLAEDGSLQYDDGSSTRNQYVDRHVIWENELDKDQTIRNTLNAVAYADIYFLKDFTFTVKGNLNLRNTDEKTYDNSIIGNGKGSGGRTKNVRYNYKNWTFQQQLRWNHDFNEHNVDVLIGHENYDYNYDYMYGYKTSETFFGKGWLSNFSELSSLDGYQNNYRTESYLGRIRYSYQDKYNVEASFRRDGSSRFYKDSRWGNFGSIGANWMISNEEFMKNISWVNSLKLRADWGQVGNDSGSGYYAYMQLFTNSTYNGQGAFYLSQNAVTELKWETGESWGIAIESRLFNRWNFSIEYFNKSNKDLLFDVYQPLSAGATDTSYAESTQAMNLGTVSNYGVEIETDVDVYRNKDWKVNLAANATIIKNEVKTLPDQNKDGIVSGNYKIVEGKSRYEFYTYTWVGVDQMTGNSLYKANTEDYFYKVGDDTFGNADGSDMTDYVTVINGQPYVNNTTYALREFHGSALPSVYGSFSVGVTWKDITVNALFTYSLGGKTMDGIYRSLMSASSSTPSSYHQDLLNAWKAAPEGMTETSADRIDPNGVPRIDYSNTYNNTTSSRFLTSRDYLVFKNINVNYNLPKKWVSKLDLTSVSVNLACENVFIKTARQGLNVQQMYNGSQYNMNVPARTFIVGINAKF